MGFGKYKYILSSKCDWNIQSNNNTNTQSNIYDRRSKPTSGTETPRAATRKEQILNNYTDIILNINIGQFKL